MSKQFDFIVFIGRLQPLHNGHVQVLRQASLMSDNVFALIGSSNQPRNIKNPFSFQERSLMVQNVFTGCRLDDNARLTTVPLQDFKSDDNVWAINVQKAIDKAVTTSLGWSDTPRRGAIIGHSKDESSFYLKLFPQLELIEHSMNEIVHATDIRELYFTSNILYLREVVPRYVYDFLDGFKTRQEYADLVDEFNFIQKYKKSWAVAPYPPTFVTVDSVVVQSGHVLLIKRKANPGRGLRALPGGFVNQNERLEAAMLRELREETRLKIPAPVLRGNIKQTRVFDAPDRSLRGRTITHAFFIELPSGALPVVKGGDDAEQAKWVPLSFVREEEMYEDHFHIVQSFLGRLL